MSSLFISHASADSEMARETARRVADWGYRTVFLDLETIQAGSDWESQLYRHLKLSRGLVALLSPRFVASQWCFAEVAQARSMGKPVFPLVIEAGCTHSLLADLQMVDLTRNADDGWERLRRGLIASGLADDLPFDPDRPFPGLSAFDASDAGVFFGREEEQASLLEVLERMRRRGEPRFAIVLGASGSGKSSLVRAGVLPRLEKDSKHWLVVPPWRPGEAPAREFARKIAEAFGANNPGRSIAATLEPAMPGNAWVSMADDLRDAKEQRDASVLLVVDQLEELLTQTSGTAADAAARFRKQLRAAIEAPGSPFIVLATLRSDFLGSFQTAPEFLGLPFEDLPLGPLPAERLPRVIAGPAARVGLELEEGFVERLVTDTVSGDALPLLAFTLRQLWEHRRGNRLDVNLYEQELGSIEGGVATIADAIMARGLDPGEETALRSAFLQMVRLDDEGRFARRRTAWNALPAAAHQVLERFVKEWLLVSDTVDGERHVEVAHEALFRAWSRLAGWLQEERGLLLFRQRLARARAEWSRVSEAEDALLRGRALAEAERWAAERPETLDPDEHAFVAASVARHRREQEVERRRRRRLMSGLVAGLVAAMLLSAFAVWQWRLAEQQRRLADQQRQVAEEQRRLALARQLAVQADASLDASGEGLQRSLLLATQSLRAAWTPDGYAAWARAAALAPRRPEVWLDVGGRTVVALDRRSPWLAMVLDDGTVRITDDSSGSTLRTFELASGIDPPAQWPGAVVRFSPDAAWLVVAAARQSLSIWNTATWERTEIRLDATGFLDLAFDPTGERLVVGGYREPLRFIEVGSWRDLFLGERNLHQPIRAIDFRAGQLVVATTSEIAFWDVTPGQGPSSRVLTVEIGSGDAIQELTVGDSSALALLTERSGLHYWPPATVDEALEAARREQPDPTNTAGRRVPSRELDERRGSWQAPMPPAQVVTFGEGDTRILTGAVSGRTARFDSAARVWLAASGEESSRLYPGGPGVFARGGQAITVGGSQPGHWSLPSRSTVTSLDHASSVTSVAFSPDGRWLAAGLEDATIVVRETGSWSEVGVRTLEGPAVTVGFTPDSQWLLGQTGRRQEAGLRVFRSASWEPVWRAAHEDNFTIYVSPDSRFIRTHTPSLDDRYEGLKRASRTRIWDIPTGREVAWRSHEQEDRAANGKLAIAEGTLPLGQEGDPALLEQANGWPALRTAPESRGGMNRTRTSPGNLWLAGYGNTQGLVLLEAATGRGLVTFGPEQTSVADVDFSPDGRWLASAEGSFADIWLLGPTEALIDDACDRANRNLTPQEWSTFVGGDPEQTCPTLRVPASQEAVGGTSRRE